MSSSETILEQGCPTSIRSGVSLPRRERLHPSPVDWRDEVLYFLLVDRFSDGKEATRPLLDRQHLGDARPARSNGEPWRWDAWAKSGAERWQGGTIQGVISKLDYLKALGVTAIWLSPVFKQRGHLNTYHGYGIQNFLDVDPRCGDRRDLVDLVKAAHDKGLRIILDIIFNHSGSNWLYPPDTPGGEYEPWFTTGRYPFGDWRGDQGQRIDSIQGGEDGAWPTEIRDAECYTRAGKGYLDRGKIDDPYAEHKRSDFMDLRDLNLDAPGLLSDLSRCYKYWIALTDCDGFRIDTLKHVSTRQARDFCGSIKEFAANLGKENFLLVGEMAGGDSVQDSYLDALSRNLNAALDIGEMRPILGQVAKGNVHPGRYFGRFDPVYWGVESQRRGMASHRSWGTRHVSILDDHDHVLGAKIRFSSGASSDHQVAAGLALQLFTLGIPCIYYGTEQAFAGPEGSEVKWLPEWKGSDRYLREAMFGPEHPRKGGTDGLHTVDPDLPGFGPFGTAGHHCFDQTSPAYLRICAMMRLRNQYPVLSHGRQYLRSVSIMGRPFGVYGPGEILAWSRILDDEEALCVLNTHGGDARGADITVDTVLNPLGSHMTVVLNSAQAGTPHGFAGGYPVGSTVPVQPADRNPDERAFIEIRDLPPSEVLVLVNHP